MNTSALKSFAPAVRRQLMEAVTRKLDYVLSADTPDLRQAAEQVKSLRKEVGRDRTALIERVAYTWSNRLAAIRLLDARGWHPFHARVLTPATAEDTQPELLKLVRTGSLPEELRLHTDPDRLNDLLDGRLPTSISGADPQGEVYRNLILAVCRFYHATLPFLFEQLNDETELLLPDDLLTATSIAEGFRTEISDDDCKDVEILGWFYQFYISEKKDIVMGRKSAVQTEDIPAVTQLFTPHWIVRYLVENSLGRLWLLNRPVSKLREHMPYYIESEPEANFLKIGKPEDIKLLDPASGSGHMLTYAFDLLVKIYEEEGYPPSQIAELILTHNLYGLEICPRAAQLAQFALLCKAREISRSAFRKAVEPKVICLEDVRFEEGELNNYFKSLDINPSSFIPHTSSFLTLLHQFEEAKNFGSLIQPCLDEQAIAFARRNVETMKITDLILRETHRKVLRVLEQAEALTQRYHVVVANPPYMGRKGMNAKLGTWLEEKFPLGKSDLMTCFMERHGTLCLDLGFWSMINLPSWMFIGTFEKLRDKIISNWTVVSLLHLGRGIFGSDFGSVAFVVQASSKRTKSKSVFRKLFERHVQVRSVNAIEKLFLKQEVGKFVLDQSNFQKIPGSPFAYWVDQRVFRLFESGSLKDHYELSNCIQPGNSEQFLRLWHEVSIHGLKNKWQFASKGGPYKKWYGNREYVINYGGAGKELLQHPSTTLRTPEKYFQEGIVWTRVTSGATGFRWWPSDCLVTDAGPIIYAKDLPLLGFLNSNLTKYLLEAISPTLNLQVGSVGVLPFTIEQSIASDAEEVMEIARRDWESLETSDGFREDPLLSVSRNETIFAHSVKKLEDASEARVCDTERLEKRINLAINTALGLGNLIASDVPRSEITLACNPHFRYGPRNKAEHLSLSRSENIRAFLSYAVGCMMGRYSLDHPGLILANAGDSLREFLAKVGRSQDQLTFAPDEDAIIPVVDGEWFEDDIVARTRDFLKAVFGAAHLDENVAWLEQTLDKDLRKYFVRDYYKDHLQTYKKRPIYWLISSPEGSFQTLIYLHRYTKDTVNTLLNNYLREFIHKLEARVAHLAHVEATSPNAREKTAARKESDKLRKSVKECQEWEREVVLPLAQRRIELDLDDGVKVNYLKFPGLLAKIPSLEKKEED